MGATATMAFRTYVLDSPMIVFMEGWPSEPWARERVSEPTGVVINSDVNPLNTPVNTLFYQVTSRFLLILR